MRKRLTDLCQGLKTSPFKVPLKTWALVPLFILVAGTIGFRTRLLEPVLLTGTWAWILPFTLFVFPSFLEELFFRGFLIPRACLEQGTTKTWAYILCSTALFVAWHPFNALTVNPTAVALFTNPWFLLMVTALGITCGYAYVQSRSLWVPVLIHWLTVVIWVLFLSGRNLVME